MIRNKKVKIHRTFTDEQKTQAVAAVQEAMNFCGGRMNLSMTSGVDAQIISNCLYQQRVSPQAAIKMELALTEMPGGKKFTKEYFCPDLNEMDWARVVKSIDKAA